MITANKKKIYFFPLILLIYFVITTYSIAQIELTPKVFELSDSTKAKNNIKWQNLNNWHNYNQTELSLKYFNKNNNIDNNRYHPSNVMPKDPFKLDYRSSSYYVPRMVKDELSLIMNRPKDNAFVPVLGVAFIAAQLAAKYVFVQDKLKISNENILNTIDEFGIMNELWKKSPQTSSELYKISKLRNKFTLKELNYRMNNLIDNKLVKQKNLEDQELQYFPAISKSEYDKLFQQINTDSTIIEKSKIKIQTTINK